MDKKALVSYIEKYHLDELVEAVVWKIHNKVAEIKFQSLMNSTAGVLHFPFDIEDSEFGISDTHSLLKLFSIMKDSIEIKLHQEHGIFMKMNLVDEIYHGSFSLADIKVIEQSPTVDFPKVSNVSFSLDKDFKDQYLKAYVALGKINRFQVETTTKDIKITLGNKESYANKISFHKHCPDFLPLSPKSFSGEAIAKILKCNSDFSKASLEIFSEGIMRIYFTDDKYTVNYYLVELEEV